MELGECGETSIGSGFPGCVDRGWFGWAFDGGWLWLVCFSGEACPFRVVGYRAFGTLFCTEGRTAARAGAAGVVAPVMGTCTEKEYCGCPGKNCPLHGAMDLREVLWLGKRQNWKWEPTGVLYKFCAKVVCFARSLCVCLMISGLRSGVARWKIFGWVFPVR